MNNYAETGTQKKLPNFKEVVKNNLTALCNSGDFVFGKKFYQTFPVAPADTEGGEDMFNFNNELLDFDDYIEATKEDILNNGFDSWLFDATTDTECVVDDNNNKICTYTIDEEDTQRAFIKKNKEFINIKEFTVEIIPEDFYVSFCSNIYINVKVKITSYQEL